MRQSKARTTFQGIPHGTLSVTALSLTEVYRARSQESQKYACVCWAEHVSCITVEGVQARCCGHHDVVSAQGLMQLREAEVL